MVNLDELLLVPGEGLVLQLPSELVEEMVEMSSTKTEHTGYVTPIKVSERYYHGHKVSEH